MPAPAATEGEVAVTHTLEAGPELDGLVAKAIGLPVRYGEFHQLGVGNVTGYHLVNDIFSHPPRNYSTDWNAAMLAICRAILAAKEAERE